MLQSRLWQQPAAQQPHSAVPGQGYVPEIEETQQPVRQAQVSGSRDKTQVSESREVTALSGWRSEGNFYVREQSDAGPGVCWYAPGSKQHLLSELLVWMLPTAANGWRCSLPFCSHGREHCRRCYQQGFSLTVLMVYQN